MSPRVRIGERVLVMAGFDGYKTRLGFVVNLDVRSPAGFIAVSTLEEGWTKLGSVQCDPKFFKADPSQLKLAGDWCSIENCFHGGGLF